MQELYADRVLLADGRIEPATLVINTGLITEVREGQPPRHPETALMWRGKDYTLLPGMIDLHGDAFERQVMPRPGVHFSHELALLETDRQMLSNGLTTAYHGLTWSWEPGLRGAEAARAFVAALLAARPRLGCDTRLHLRHETYNTEAEAEIVAWMESGVIDLLAFNDHLAMITEKLETPQKLAVYAGRTGMDVSAFRELIEAVTARQPQVAPSIQRLAEVARRLGIPMASHDDESPEDRQALHALGSRICEFPVDRETATYARGLGDHVIVGAPNVVRGGSHCDRLNAGEAVAEGIGSVLTSDYFYPALLAAVYQLAGHGPAPQTLDLAEAWALVAANPAEAVGLTDRGRLAVGLRADVVCVEALPDHCPRVVQTLVAGRTVYAGGV